MTHFLFIEKSNREELLGLLADAQKFKVTRVQSNSLLSGQTWSLIFNKPSSRTRVSFEVGLRELGANVIFLSQNDLQLGRGEPIIDTARVLGRIVHGAIIRTFAQADIESFASYGAIPTINALTDEEHPCQIVADLFTILAERGNIDDLRACFVGDGDCNVTRSWILAAGNLGFELLVAAPRKYQPAEALKGRIKFFKSRRRNTICLSDWSSDVCSSDLGSIFEILYRRYVPRLGHNQTIGVIAHRLCRLIWKILHQGVRYEERGPSVCKKSKQRRAARDRKSVV